MRLIEDRKGLQEELFGSVNEETLQAFKKYHFERPNIYSLFDEYAKMMAETGRKRYSAKCIMERIRWDQDMKYREGEFKISNSFTSLYARLFVYMNPEYKDFFQFKKVRGLKKPQSNVHYLNEDKK